MRTVKIIVPEDFDPERHKLFFHYNGDDEYPGFPEPEGAVELWKPTYRDILDHGFLGMVDFMGGDDTVVNAARVSYGTGTRRVSEDKNLIRYLIRNRHWSPVEMVEVMWHVKAPIFVFRQWHRHRMASINEYSARYSEMSDDMYLPNPDVMMPQSTTNKQGRAGEMAERNKFAALLQIQSIFKQCAQAYRYLLGKTKVPDDSLNHRFDLIREFGMKQIKWLEKSNPDWSAEKVNDAMIDAKLQEIFHAQGLEHTDEDYWGEDGSGLSRELARMVMPLATYSEMYWKSDLRNTFNFISLRADTHAQKEIRDYADAMFEMLEPIAPVCVAAFGDYILRGRQFSEMEMSVARALYKNFGKMNITEAAKYVEGVMADLGASKRETREFIRDMEVGL